VDPSLSVTETAQVLKQKMIEKVQKLRLPFHTKDKYKLALEFHCIKFPPLPSAELALAFVPSYPSWFDCMSYGDIINALKPLKKRVVWAKCYLYNFQGHIHIDIQHVEARGNDPPAGDV